MHCKEENQLFNELNSDERSKFIKESEEFDV